MSINFFPLVATLCHAHQIPYLAWCYDSPLEEKLEECFSYDTNRIFLFDRIEAEHYQSLGYSRVYHLPLAVNTDRLDRLQFSPAQMQKHRCDVSFIGHLYESPLQVLLYSADDYIKGYIEGILQAQLRVYGYYFIDELITDELLDSVNQSSGNRADFPDLEPQRIILCHSLRDHEPGTVFPAGADGRIVQHPLLYYETAFPQ